MFPCYIDDGIGYRRKFITDRLLQMKNQCEEQGPHTGHDRPAPGPSRPLPQGWASIVNIWLAKGANVGPLGWVGTLRCEHGSATTFPNLMTLREGFNTQVITLGCFYIVGREILTLGEGFNTQVITLGCFYIVVQSGTMVLARGPRFRYTRSTRY
jgi:hypothetical protein